MAINITAKNVYITVKDKHYSVSKTREITSEKVEIVANKDNLQLISNKKVLIKGNN